MATLNSLADRLRTELGDMGKSFVWQTKADGTTNRSGTILPVMGRYTNSDTTVKAIYFQFNKDSSDDSMTLAYNGNFGFWLKITEIGR